MLTNVARVFKFGWYEFLRNIGISVGTIFIMFITLSILAGTVFLRGTTQNLISALQKKVDVSVYFNPSVAEKDIFKVKERIENFPQIDAVSYVSREKALESFKEEHKNDPQIMEALEEIGDNPLPASLNVRASAANTYEALANFLEKGEFKSLIEKVNYRQNKSIIDKLFSISNSIKNSGIVLSLLLIFIALTVTFNTIRLAIYSKKREIEVMKFIGATDWFVRGPFLIEGVLLGLFAGFFSFLLFYGVDAVLSAQGAGIFSELNLLSFFENNILFLLLIQFGGGIILGAVSSIFATQKHLRV
ncbi:MAG: permease-like cell division protein FtsX [Patescibacteria group bacterium]